MYKKLDKSLFTVGDSIVNIPDLDSYRELLRILAESGYNVFRKYTDVFESNFLQFPKIVYTSKHVCGGTNMYIGKRKIDYYTFISYFQEDSGNWREKLSNMFNNKIKTYGESKMDS